jgi:hypothetical protein
MNDHLHDYAVTPFLCPYCGHFCDAATEAVEGEGAPGEGDYTVCIGCAGLLRFGPIMSLHKVSDEEAQGMSPEVQHTISKMQMAVRLTNWLNPPRNEKGN